MWGRVPNEREAVEVVLGSAGHPVSDLPEAVALAMLVSKNGIGH